MEPTPPDFTLPPHFSPEMCLQQYRLSIVETEKAWKDVEDKVLHGNTAEIHFARQAFEQAVLNESNWLERIYEHTHQIDCCSNNEEEC